MFKPARVLITASILALVPLFLLVPFSISRAASSGDVVINEIAWMGTEASSYDEWIEFYNNTDSEIDVTGWGLYEDGGSTLIEPLEGTIVAHSYFLVERTDDNTVSDVDASQTPSSWQGYGLSNNGEYLVLKDDAGLVIDDVDCSSDWFAGEKDAGSRATMERIDPEVSGSDSSNWADNNGVTINGQDANGDPLAATPKAQNSVYGQSGDEGDNEELSISFTLPSEATAGEGFDVPVTVEKADPSTEYYAKAMIGESTESASLRKGYTYNSILDKWLAWNGAWSKMPTFETDADGDASFTLKSKVKDDASSGTYYFLVRIRKVGTDDNLDSDAKTFFVNESSGTSDTSGSSDPEVTFSVEGDDLKVNKSFDVKIEIKNAKPLHDYYVKIRLGLSESKLTKGRTYNSFYDEWLADNKSWSKFPILYTDSSGTWDGTISAKVATGKPADTYYIRVRIRDKETEKNYDSETQTITVGAEDPPEADAAGSVLGATTELPQTGVGVTSLVVKNWLPVLIWMVLIFIGSSLPGASVSESRTVDFLAHKAVHLFEYSILFILIHRAAKRSFSFTKKTLFATFSFLLTVSYAITDEIHQLFVRGRDAKFHDIIIDAIAATIGWLVVRRKRDESS